MTSDSLECFLIGNCMCTWSRRRTSNQLQRAILTKLLRFSCTCRFKEEAGDKVRCDCGAPNCKGTLN